MKIRRLANKRKQQQKWSPTGSRLSSLRRVISRSFHSPLRRSRTRRWSNTWLARKRSTCRRKPTKLRSRTLIRGLQRCSLEASFMQEADLSLFVSRSSPPKPRQSSWPTRRSIQLIGLIHYKSPSGEKSRGFWRVVEVPAATKPRKRTGRHSLS